jgi:hypothetical protein
MGSDKLKKRTLVLPMVRVDRLYLGPMSAPEPMGSDQMWSNERNWVVNYCLRL